MTKKRNISEKLPRMKTRVIFFISCYVIGGYETRLRTIVNTMDQKQFDIHVILLYPQHQAKSLKKDIRKKYRQQLENGNIGPHLEFLIMKHSADISVIFKMTRYIQSIKPDVMAFFSLGPGTFLGPLVGRISGIPLIFRLSGTILEGLYPKFLSFIDRLLLTQTDGIIVPSRFLKHHIMSDLKIPDRKIIVIPNGIHLNRFQGNNKCNKALIDKKIPSHSPIIGQVGNLVPLKAQHIFLKAVPFIRSEIPEAHFVLIGEGRERKHLERLAKKLHIQPVVHFLGYRKDISDLLCCFDIGVLSSQVETFGNALVEMMASGVPVVATRVGAVPEIIENGINGILVPPNNPQILAEEVIRLFKNPRLAESMIRAGKKIVQNRYSHQMMVNNLQSVFSEWSLNAK